MKKTYIPIALLLIGIGLLLGPSGLVIPNWINPIPHSAATVVIIENTNVRSSLTVGQIALMESVRFPTVIQASGGIFLGCFSEGVLDREKKPPVELIPYLEAAKKLGTLPALVIKRGSITAIPLPADEKTALEKVK